MKNMFKKNEQAWKIKNNKNIKPAAPSNVTGIQWRGRWPWKEKKNDEKPEKAGKWCFTASIYEIVSRERKNENFNPFFNDSYVMQ